MSGTLPNGDNFAAHVHEIVDLDEHGASLGAVEESIGSMSLGVEEQSALRVLASSLHAGAHPNQSAGAAKTLKSAYAALEITRADKQTQLSTDRWTNEGGGLACEAPLLAPLRVASAFGNESGEAVPSKWSWHDDAREIERW